MSELSVNQGHRAAENETGLLEQTRHLAELIDAKWHVLQQMRDLARRQMEYVTQGDMERLMQVLAAKDSLIRRLLDLEKQLDPFRPQDPQQRRWASSDARRRCQLAAERCETLLKEIWLLEKQGETALCRRRDETAQRLDVMDGAAQAQRAYAGQSGPAHGQLDLSSEQ